jgi:hypothetical protein
VHVRSYLRSYLHSYLRSYLRSYLHLTHPHWRLGAGWPCPCLEPSCRVRSVSLSPAPPGY